MSAPRLLSQFLFIGVFGLLLNLHHVAHAQHRRTVTVTGAGSASASPDVVIVKGTIEGRGEDGSTAYENYEGVKRSLREKLGGKEDAKISLVFRGEKLTTPSTSIAMAVRVAAIPGGGAAEEPTEIIVREAIEVRIEMENDMERMQISKKIAQTLDEAKDAGVKFSTGSSEMTFSPFQQQNYLAEFLVKDGEALRDNAFVAAMKNARRRARILAELAGGKLGDIISVEESRSVEEQDPVSRMILLSSGKQPNRKSEFSANENREIQFKQELKVVFELVE